MSKLGKLSDVEMEIMQAIWAQSAPVTVAQLLAIFETAKGWKTSTMSTMLERIIAKGFLIKSMKGKANYYRITATFEDYQRQEGRNLLSALYGGSITNFVAALANDGEVSREDIAELQAWFDSMSREGEQ